MSKNYSTVNPCVMCMPLGSAVAFRGIENTMPFFHGSQGCSTYIRLHLAHHFREPVDIASSALSEKGAIYGGAANLKQGIKNVIKGYDPRMIGIATTCLAETIGEDLHQILAEFRQEEPLLEDVIVVPVSTPSYSHSHEEGYNEALWAVVQALAAQTRPNNKVNFVVSSMISPADIRYVKQMLEDSNCSNILLPDISETFDAPIVENPSRIPAGGTPLDDIIEMANSKKTVTLGTCLQNMNAGTYLNDQFSVPHTVLPLPIGIGYTDLFVSTIEKITGYDVPRKYDLERGRLLDAMIDVHKYVANVKTAVFGDTDIVLGITSLLTELGMDPAIVATGSNNPVFMEQVDQISPNSRILTGVDFTEIHGEIKDNDIELMIGPFTGRQISRTENIPLVRVGFPNHDRVGTTRQLILGYEGAMRLIDTITNTIIENK
jgi:nitrogenase molybdenum-iron protein NifN